MSKTFDVEAAQATAADVRGRMLGQVYRHYKGGLYVVRDVAIDESTGDILVVYRSDEHGYVWVRKLSVFTGLVAGQFRFAPTKKQANGTYI